ncbi:MAG TPA: VOC family protein, partial [Ferruginibacter sp.]|nr:VOC family protein [Ferruginibacter sp.]
CRARDCRVRGYETEIQIITFNHSRMQHAISWFEIPTTDINRAQKFYEAIFSITMVPMDLPNIKMRMFPLDDMMTQVGGALVDSGGFHKASATDGPLVYLNGNPDVQIILDRVEAAGGKIMLPKTEISPEYGFMAVIYDTEGNRIGLHSIPQ